MNDTDDCTAIAGHCLITRVRTGEVKEDLELNENDDLRPHYDFDYSKAKPNRFAEFYKNVPIMIIDKDEDITNKSDAEPETK